MAPLSRTFECILEEDYDGRIECFFEEAKISNQKLHQFLVGREVGVFHQAVIAKIGEFLGEDVEVLFPDALYRHPQFSSIQDAPGYRLIQKHFGLRFNKNKGALFHLLLDRGCSANDYRSFTAALRGTLIVFPHHVKIVHELGFELFEVFPPSLYEYSSTVEGGAVQDVPYIEAQDSYRVPFEATYQLTHDSKSAMELLDAAVSPREQSLDALRLLIRTRLLPVLSDAQRKVIAYRFGFVDEQFHTGEETARAVGLNSREAVDSVLQRGIGRMRALLAINPDLAQELLEAAGDGRQDRVFL